MTQEEKDLLLRDLCARLPYGVKCCIYNFGEDIVRIKEDILWSVQGDNILTLKSCVEKGEAYLYHQIRPYLFPFSSMTEGQKEELNKKFNVQFLGNTIYSIHYHSEGCWDTDLELGLQDWLWFINWCYKNHFDINNLIEKGLAIDATGLNIY